MSTVIEIENLYKEYRLGTIGYGTLREDLQTWWAKIRGKEDPNSLLYSFNQSDNGRVPDHILALNNINLTVKKGERLGIIGKNGAGKTTLLKILAQIASPTKGSARIKGRVASLIAVGTGFHGELTGRENVYLNGAILGLSKSEINERFDEIVGFSGVEQFIDTPVKRYSSGMNIRLGFAVAAHLEPDILIVDEVLAVGDYEFQKKCIGKMSDVASEGRTILFVTHNLGSVRELCSRTILLENGKKILDGQSNEVISNYINTSMKKGVGEKIMHSTTDSTFKDMHNLSGELFRLNAVRSLIDSGKICNTFSVRDNIFIELEYDVFVHMEVLGVEIRLKNDKNEVILFTYDDANKSTRKELKRDPGRYVSTCKIPKDFLNNGRYWINVTIGDEGKTYIPGENMIFFEVIDSKDPEGARGHWTLSGSFPPAVVRPKLDWDITHKPFKEQ